MDLQTPSDPKMQYAPIFLFYIFLYRLRFLGSYRPSMVGFIHLLFDTKDLCDTKACSKESKLFLPIAHYQMAPSARLQGSNWGPIGETNLSELLFFP